MVLSVWENEINTMKQGESYHLENVPVREYIGKKFVHQKEASLKRSQINDETQVETSADATPGTNLKDVKIIGLQWFECYNACFKCKVVKKSP